MTTRSTTMRAALAFLLFVVAWPGSAAAQDAEPEEQVAVILFNAKGVDPAQSSRMGDVLRRTMRLAAQAGLKIPAAADLDKKNDGMLVIEGEQHLMDAHRYFSRGSTQLELGRFSDAYEEFERALHFYRSAYPYAQDDRLHTDITFYASEMAQRMRGKREREKAFKRCEAIGLALELAGAPEFLDKVNEIHDECEWEIEDQEKRELDVATDPQGARVYVDGQFRGVTPTKLRNLRRGEHVFTFVREGYRRVSRILHIGKKFAETSELEMGLHLKPGVYRDLYKTLIPVVQGGNPKEFEISQKTADELQVDGLLMVLAVPAKKGAITVHTTLWSGPGKALKRDKFELDLGTPDKIENAVVQMLADIYGVEAADLPSLAERPPIYFKLELPPYVVEEGY